MLNTSSWKIILCTGGSQSFTAPCANRASCRRTIHRLIVLHRRLSVLKTSGQRVPSSISHYARKLVPAHTYDVSLPAARAAAVKSRITAAVWNRGCPLQPAPVSRRFQPSLRIPPALCFHNVRVYRCTHMNSVLLQTTNYILLMNAVIQKRVATRMCIYFIHFVHVYIRIRIHKLRNNIFRVSIIKRASAMVVYRTFVTAVNHGEPDDRVIASSQERRTPRNRPSADIT